MNAVTLYIQESIRELELVRWPTRQQAIRLSMTVLAFTLANAAVFGLVDVLLGNSLAFFLNRII
jgi:preprotein translocase SecE subunit